jgi:hypothetical protein
MSSWRQKHNQDVDPQITITDQQYAYHQQGGAIVDNSPGTTVMDVIHRDRLKKMENWFVFILFALITMQFGFFAGKITDYDNDGVPWPVVFIPTYFAYGLFILKWLVWPSMLNKPHAWYLASTWMLVGIVVASQLVAMILLLVHLQGNSNTNLLWAMFLTLGLGTLAVAIRYFCKLLCTENPHHCCPDWAYVWRFNQGYGPVEPTIKEITV